MKQSKYSIPDYWKSKLIQDEEFWCGLFENKPITRESVIINPVILNSHSDQEEDTWVVYPNPHSIIGFLKFFYLPTAFIGLIEEETANKYYFADDLDGLLEEYKEEYSSKIDLITKMEQFYYELSGYWNKDYETCLTHLEEWSKRFNEEWAHVAEGVTLTFNLFRSPEETMNYIIASYEGRRKIKTLEENIGFTKRELLDLAGDTIYANDFMKRKFTNILEDRLTLTI